MDLSFASLILIVGLFVPMGAAMLVAGWRGRRVGDHPHCRRCGFDLFGGDGTRCPECGSDVSQSSATRVGARHTRPGLVAAGAAMLLVSLSLVGLLGLATISSANLQPYKPVWWLSMELGSSDSATVDAAFAELDARLQSGALSQPQIDGLVDQALGRQADLARPWVPKWGELVDSAHAGGHVDAARMERYARQAVVGTLTLEVRPRVRRGDPIPYRTRVGPARVGEQMRLYLRLHKNRSVVADIGIDPHGGSSSSGLSNSANGSFGSSFRLTETQWATVPLGKNDFTLSVEASVGESHNQSDPAIWESTLTFTAPIEVVPADQPTVRAVVDESQRPALEAALSAQPLELRNPWKGGGKPRLGVMIDIRRPPVSVAFEVIARAPDGREWPLGTVSRSAGDSTTYHVDGEVTDIPDGLETIDLVLRPSEDAAVRTVDVFDYWGDEVVLKDVPIEDKRTGAGP